MTAIAHPSFWLPPSMRQHNPRAYKKSRWLDRAKRWKRRLLDVLAPIGAAADGDIMLDPNGELVLDPAGEVELQNATGCTACCPGCATCWTNDIVPSVNIAIDGYNYPTDWICSFPPCSEDPLYGTGCDPCGYARFNFQSGSIDTSYNVPASSIPACPGFGGGPPTDTKRHWRVCTPSPFTYLFARAFDTTQIISTQFLLIDMTCCCTAGGCQVTLEIFLIGCACDNSGAFLLTMFGGSASFTSMPDSFTLDNEIVSADAAWGDPNCNDHTTGGRGGTATVTKGT